jgi:1-aminocyclopropane-1-carboxylate deaminase/D-cysteine desulfhydrase-like pyridoxal-dependent ACC family enzyme
MKTSRISAGQVRANLSRIARREWAFTPTPLDDLPRLTEELRGPRILAKRDDLTGFAFGGNKARHFGFEMAHVTAAGYDTLININHFHSNQARFAAAGCARAGIKYVLVSTGEVDRPLQGNLLLCKLLGAEIHRITEGQNALEYARSVAERLRAEGRRPYILNEDSFPDIMGMLGFLEAGLELSEQLRDAGVRGPVHLWGLTGRSIAGLVLLARNLGLAWTATACKYSPSSDESVGRMMIDRSAEAAALVGLPVALRRGDIEVLSDYAGPGYGRPTPGVFEAIHLAARTESLILDPNYTGKSMWGLIDQVQRGRFNERDTVVFIHSGGLPQLFAFAEELAAYQS